MAKIVAKFVDGTEIVGGTKGVGRPKVYQGCVKTPTAGYEAVAGFADTFAPIAVKVAVKKEPTKVFKKNLDGTFTFLKFATAGKPAKNSAKQKSPRTEIVDGVMTETNGHWILTEVAVAEPVLA